MTRDVTPEPRAVEQLRIMFEQHRDGCWEQVYVKRANGSDMLAREFAARAEVWDLAARLTVEVLSRAVPPVTPPADQPEWVQQKVAGAYHEPDGPPATPPTRSATEVLGTMDSVGPLTFAPCPPAAEPGQP